MVEAGLIRGTGGTVLINASSMLLNFALLLSLSHTIGVAGLGAYANAFAWASLLAVPSVLGLTPLVVRNVAAYLERKEWGLLRGMLLRAQQAVLISSGLLVIGGGAVGVAVLRSRPELLHPFLIGLALVPIIALTSIRQAAMQGLGRVVLGRMPEAFAPALFLLLLGVVYLFERKSFSAGWAVSLQVAAWAAALGWGAFLLRRALPQHVRTERPQHAMREWVRSALPLLAFAGVQALNAQIEVILLGAIKGAAAAGLFSVASRVAGLVTFVMVAAGYPLSPVLARLHASGETALLRRTVRRAAFAVFAASVPLAAGVLIFARPLLALFGGQFKGGETALILLALSQLFFAGTGFAGTVLVMTGNESWLVRSVLIGAVLEVALNAALIPPFGLTGAAAGSAVGVTALSVSVAYFARTRAEVSATAFGI